jgi:glycosyltransferase involved in cell wall biosynthesis
MADIVTFPTTFIQKRIVVDFPTVTHHVVIFNGISITPCTYTLSRHSPVRILAITNFNHAEKARGISLLCDALEAVRAMGIPTTLTIVGGGTYFSQYKEKYTGENIIFLGFKEHATSYFYTHDVFVHATFLDNAPYTILEAVASCIPTVSVSIGGIPELLPHTSCAEPTVESLATILESLLTSPYACEENVRTNQVMLRQFDWKTISNAYVQLYSS